LGEFTPELATRLNQSMASRGYLDLQTIPTVGSFGIFNTAAEIVPESFGSVGETLTEFKERLIPKLRSFLGKKLINTLFGIQAVGIGDHLQVSAELEIFKEAGVAKLSSRNGLVHGTNLIDLEGAIPLLPVGTETQIKIINEEDQSLYIGFLVFDQIGHLSTVFPNIENSAESDALVAPGESFMFNRRFQRVTHTSERINISDPLGTTELLILASKEPIHRPLKALQQLMSVTRSRGAFDEIDNFVKQTRGVRGFGKTANNFSIPISIIGSTSITFKAIQ
jgi:hypothetical protein